MSELDLFRDFLLERLAMEALEIVGAVEKTFTEYQYDESARLPRLDVKPEINLHLTGFVFNKYLLKLLSMSVRSTIYVALFHTIPSVTLARKEQTSPYYLRLFFFNSTHFT